MSTRYIVGIIAIVVIMGGGVFLFISKPIENPISSMSDGNATQTTNVPSDWVSYKNSKLGISFKYPPNWVKTEDERQIKVQGDGYAFVVDLTGGHGLPEEVTYTHPQYEIDGLNATTFEDDSGAGFTIFLSVYISKDKGGFSFRVTSDSNKSKILTDQILSTVAFKYGSISSFGSNGLYINEAH